MSSLSAQPFTFLRRALVLDAVATRSPPVLRTAPGGLIDGWLGLPVALLRGAGLVLVPYVAFGVVVATRARIEPAAVWCIIACNVLWAVASLALLLSGQLAPTGLGIAFVLAQAI